MTPPIIAKFQSPLNGRNGIGVTIGKFMPLHKGHELMIEMAAAELDELVVIVSDEKGKIGNAARLDVRFNLIKQKYSGYDNIRVVKHIDTFGPPKEYDEQGTAIDSDFWNYWINVFKILAPNATHVVSSDRYGKVMAEQLCADWFPVDPDRELMPISASKIRENPHKYWKYISREFRPMYATKVVVIGPESSGKSTLVKDLGEYFGSPAVPEYGRILSDAKSGLDEDDFTDIVRRHEKMTKFAAMESDNGLVFVDTEKLVTYLYGQVYLDMDIMEIKRRISASEFDLWVLVPPLLPWDDDGTRVMSNLKDRQEFYNKLEYHTRPRPGGTRPRGQLGYRTFNRLILKETDRQKRVEIVATALAQKLNKDFDDSVVTNMLTNQDVSLTMNE